MPASPFKPIVGVVERDGKYYIVEDDLVKEEMQEGFVDSVTILKEEYLRSKADTSGDETKKSN